MSDGWKYAVGMKPKMDEPRNGWDVIQDPPPKVGDKFTLGSRVYEWSGACWEWLNPPEGEWMPGQTIPTWPAPAEPPGTGLPPGNHITGNPKHAAGIAKPQINLVPPIAFVLMAKVFELGARKYGPFNWRDAAVVRSIYLAAALRHLLAMEDGQDLDPESGFPHSAHVQACMAIIQDAEALGKLIDDRPPHGPMPGVLASLTPSTQGGVR